MKIIIETMFDISDINVLNKIFCVAQDTKGFGTPTKMLMSLMLHPSINKQKNSGGYDKVTMKLLTDFCVSQPIPLLGMITEDKFVFNTHIYSPQKFFFTFCLRSPFKSYQYGVHLQSALLTLTVCNFLAHKFKCFMVMT